MINNGAFRVEPWVFQGFLKVVTSEGGNISNKGVVRGKSLPAMRNTVSFRPVSDPLGGPGATIKKLNLNKVLPKAWSG